MNTTLDTLPLPQIAQVARTDTSARYTIEPLATGYGTTLGSALRRVLLTALPGPALTALHIAGLHAGVTDIPGVREDVAEILLNLRRVRVRYEGEGPTTLTLDLTEPGEVTAGRIATPPDVPVEIVTPDQYLLTLDAGAELHATLTVERGTGYAEVPEDGDAAGRFHVAGLFTPIRRVQYAVEHARIGPITTYDRLVLEIETDGTLTPDEALHRAATDLVGHFARVSTAIGVGAAPTPIPTAAPLAPPSAAADSTPLAALALSPRAYNALRRASLLTVGDALALRIDALLTLRNFGRTSARELRDALVRAGILTEAQAAERFGALGGDADEASGGQRTGDDVV